MVFPYPGEDDFCRVKIFPPFTDEYGHTVKYLQRKGSGVHFYVLPLAHKALPGPMQAMAYTEGEKKSAKACQELVPYMGVDGLWNWRTEDGPIPMLDRIAHVDREELLYPNSDVWTKPDILWLA